VWHAARTAVDLDLDRPVLLLVTVSVHRCRPCRHFLRAQPPFLRPDAVYTNRVVATAVQSVYADGMAFGRVAARLARDFWVRPSEATIRGWCRDYVTGPELLGAARDYRRWVVEEFSGVLCIDEVYQGRLALLLAVDPAAPDGDRLVGYQLVHGKVGQADVAGFLWRLHQMGIRPAEVVTDGSGLYPALLAAVWPAAAHQLCLFHETRIVTKAVQQVVWQVTRAARAQVPKLPAPHELRGQARKHPQRAAGAAAGAAAAPGAGRPSGPADDWTARRHAAIALAHGLRRRGWSLVGIARRTGYNRSTVRRWLRAPLPPPEPAAPAAAGGGAPAPAPTGKRATPPPAPWRSWDEVGEVRQGLASARFLLVHRPEHLTERERVQLDVLLQSPVGEPLRVARAFLEDWFLLWRDGTGQKRPLAEARARFDRWRANPAYRALPPLRRAQDRLDAARFARLSHFLGRPEWEATSNGAERMARQFRHRQAPHFRLRAPAAVEGAITVSACQRKQATTERGTGGPGAQASRSARGRKRRCYEAAGALAA
jgi:lambda repressor-like predicted transcriptional regulator